MGNQAEPCNNEKNKNRVENFVNNKIEIVEKDESKCNLEFIVIGETGQGKSQFGNFISRQKDFFEVGNSCNSMTGDIKVCKFNRCNHEVIYTDTPGFNDTDGHDTTYTKKLTEYLYKHEVDMIIIAQSFANPRLKPVNAKILNDLCNIYGKGGLLHHLCVLYTYFPDYPDEDEIKKLNTIMSDIFTKIINAVGLKNVDDLNLPVYFINSKFNGPRKDDFQKQVDEMIQQASINQQRNGRLIASKSNIGMMIGGYTTAVLGGGFAYAVATGGIAIISSAAAPFVAIALGVGAGIGGIIGIVNTVKTAKNNK